MKAAQRTPHEVSSLSGMEKPNLIPWARRRDGGAMFKPLYDKLSDLWHGRHSREAVMKLREHVGRLQNEWIKFPAGLTEPERQKLLSEFLAVTEDFLFDPRLGKHVSQMRTDALRMGVISTPAYVQAYGADEQQMWLGSLNTSLQNSSAAILTATRRYALVK